jgi:hypothetical protein
MPVQPGDVITADLFNSMLNDIELLKSQMSQSPSGTAVPNFIGQTFATVRQTLNQPSTPFFLGSVLDASGNTVSPISTAFDSRIVIGQSPTGGSLATNGTLLQLILSADQSGPTPTPSPPDITRMVGIVRGVATTNEGQAGAQLTIGGRNFGNLPTDHLVTVDGQNAPVSSSLFTPGSSVTVTIPETASPDPNGATRPVLVMVTVGSLSSSPSNLRLHSVAANQPVITGIEPPIVDRTASITISGTFTGTSAEIEVFLGNESEPQDNVLARPSQVAGGQLVVPIPTGIAAVDNLTPGASTGVNVWVRDTSGNFSSPPFSIEVERTS